MRYVALCFTFLTATAAMFAQVGGTGSIQGTVTDPAGASVPNATVTATNTATGTDTVRKTTDAGFFVISLLTPGEYTLTVKATGFQNYVHAKLVVEALGTVSVSPKLEIGAATQSITVEEKPTVLKVDDAALGSSIDNLVYDSLPLAMNGAARDPSAFAGLAVGVNSYSTQAAGPSTGSYNGGQTYQNEVYIEGLPLTSAGTESDTRNLAFGVSVEAVDQFQVETAGAKAMYEGQGVSNYVFKSGTNQFHGGVFEYFRNTDFDARGIFAATTPIEHQNEFGASIGGPIKKNKLFFYGNYDGYRFLSATPPDSKPFPPLPSAWATSALSRRSSTIPAVQWAPLCGRPSSTTPSRRAAFRSISKSFQSYLPAPTNRNITNNYLATLPNKVNNDSTTDKVDFNLSDKHHLFALFSTGKYANPIRGQPDADHYRDHASALHRRPRRDRICDPGPAPRQLRAHAEPGESVQPLASAGIFIPLTSNTADGDYPHEGRA